MKRNNKPICILSPFPPPYGGMAIQAQKMASLLREGGFEVVTLRTNADLPDSLNFIARIKGLRTLLRAFLFLKNLHKVIPHVEVVYFLTGFFNFFFWVTYPALLLIKLHGKRVILSARGGGARKFFHRYGILVKPILKQVDIITIPSGFLQDVFLTSLNVETVVVPNIADLGQFKFRERFPICPRLLTTRSLERIYNVACVIKAFKSVHERFPESILGIAGDGSQRAALEQMVADLGLKGWVTFYGSIEHSKMQDLYNQYDIYVNASNVDNLPGTILEAFASGLPVVSTNPGGIPYMFENGKTGLLVEKNDCNALAERVIALLKDPELALRLSRNARKECKKYSWEYVKKVLLPLLDADEAVVTT
jgi:glycosyltransferase involved in cell wall biosynthesis